MAYNVRMGASAVTSAGAYLARCMGLETLNFAVSDAEKDAVIQRWRAAAMDLLFQAKAAINEVSRLQGNLDNPETICNS